MDSKLNSIFNISVAGGVIGLAFADAMFQGSNGLVGFGLGLLTVFTFSSGLAVISEAIQFQNEAKTKLLAEVLVQAMAGITLPTKVQKQIQHQQQATVKNQI